MNLREFIQSEIKSQISESVNEAKKPYTIVVMINGERLVVDNKDIPRLKSGKEVVGKSLKYDGQEAWVYPRFVKKIEESVNEAEQKFKKGDKIEYKQLFGMGSKQDWTTLTGVVMKVKNKKKSPFGRPAPHQELTLQGGAVVNPYTNHKDIKLAESVNEEQLDEKLITFSNRSPYGQIVFMAGGAASGK